MLFGIVQGVSYFLRIFMYALYIYCICTWILSPFNKVMRFLARIVDPFLRPVRNVLFRLFPRLPIDLSPIVLGLLVGLAQQLLWRLYMMLAF